MLTLRLTPHYVYSVPRKLTPEEATTALQTLLVAPKAERDARVIAYLMKICTTKEPS
jgi:hypothetical protein